MNVLIFLHSKDNKTFIYNAINWLIVYHLHIITSLAKTTNLYSYNQEYESGSWKRKWWKRKWWKRLNFCGSRSPLKKEAGSGSELESIWLFEEPEAEAFFIKHGAGMWKRLNFCGSGSTLKK